MLINVADFCVEVSPRCRSTREAFAPYEVSEPREADFTVTFSDDDLIAEKIAYVEMYNNTRCTLGLLERLAILRKINDEIISRGAFLMHGAVIEHDGRGYMFTAPSGTGKTTHILLWQEYFGKENVRIINGDKPFVRVIDGKVYAYGTPWCGKENLNENARTLLSAICFVEQARENSISTVTEEEALPRLLSQVEVLKSSDLSAQLDLVGVLIEKVPMYKLLCNTNADAARVAYEGMRQ